ncbi:MAG: E3 binding domain-containing protein, partial [Gammaproteobacteria bacterium]
MSIEVKVPQLPESVTDATLVSWHKSVGDPVNRDENLVDLETDKVVLEVPAPTSGVLKEIRIEDGTTVTSGEVLAVIEEGEAVAAVPPPEEKTVAGEDKAPESADLGSGQKLSPAVRRLVEEHGLDAAAITGSGRQGRITKSDVMRFMQEAEAGTEEPAQKTEIPAPAAMPESERGERRVAMTRLRSRIAERMVDAQATAAMLTSFNEVDLHEVIRLRKQYRESFEKQYGVR